MFGGIGPNNFLFVVGSADLSKDRFDFYVKEVWVVAGPTLFGYGFVVCFEMPLSTVWLFNINSVFEEECVVVFLPNVWSKAK